MTSLHPVARTRREKLVAALPLIGLHVACGLVIVYPPSWSLVALAACGYAVRMWGIAVGYHRYFAHRSYKTSRAFQLGLAILGGTALQEGPLWWASVHRRHHKRADRPGDPHSPILRGLWHAHVGWTLEQDHGAQDLSNVKDLAVYPELRWLDRHHNVPVAAYALTCWAVAGVPGVVWGLVVSSVALLHVTFSVNSLAHLWGSRRFATADGSRNNAPLAVLTLGDGWHNNHHHRMSSARHGFRWWELDVGYYSLVVLARLGLVWDLRQPAPEDRHRITRAPGTPRKR